MKVDFENFVDIVSPPDFEFIVQTKVGFQYSFLSRLVFQCVDVGLERVSMNLESFM